MNAEHIGNAKPENKDETTPEKTPVLDLRTGAIATKPQKLNRKSPTLYFDTDRYRLAEPLVTL